MFHFLYFIEVTFLLRIWREKIPQLRNMYLLWHGSSVSLAQLSQCLEYILTFNFMCIMQLLKDFVVVVVGVW